MTVEEFLAPSAPLSDKEASQVAMCGQTFAEIEADLAGKDRADRLMYAAQVLSDAQHMLTTCPERANQWINLAKYVMDGVRQQLR